MVGRYPAALYIGVLPRSHRDSHSVPTNGATATSSSKSSNPMSAWCMSTLRKLACASIRKNCSLVAPSVLFNQRMPEDQLRYYLVDPVQPHTIHGLNSTSSRATRSPRLMIRAAVAGLQHAAHFL